MALRAYCICSHTKLAHNKEGCKIYHCFCEDYTEGDVVDVNLDRTTNYGH